MALIWQTRQLPHRETVFSVLLLNASFQSIHLISTKRLQQKDNILLFSLIIFCKLLSLYHVIVMVRLKWALSETVNIGVFEDGAQTSIS